MPLRRAGENVLLSTWNTLVEVPEKRYIPGVLRGPGRGEEPGPGIRRTEWREPMKNVPARGGRRMSVRGPKANPPKTVRPSGNPITPTKEKTTPSPLPLAHPSPILEQSLRRLEEDEGRLREAIEDLRRLLETAPSPTRAASAADALDETAKTFSRAVNDVVDRRTEEVIARIAPIHQMLREEALALSETAREPDAVRGVLEEAIGGLARALESLGGGFIAPEVGEPYDPLIHLAVSEISIPGSEEGRIARVVRPGYRSPRGRVVLPARVLVARS